MKFNWSIYFNKNLFSLLH